MRSVVLLQRKASYALGVGAAIQNAIFRRPFRDSNYQLKTYLDIQTIEDWWDWHETVLLDSFYVGTQVTCFTGTNVQILTQLVALRCLRRRL